LLGRGRGPIRCREARGGSPWQQGGALELVDCKQEHGEGCCIFFFLGAWGGRGGGGGEGRGVGGTPAVLGVIVV